MFIFFFVLNVVYSDESNTFSNMLERNWMGASSGFMGIIGSMSHLSKFKFLLPGGVILFESWNYFINEISLTISVTHIISCLFGYFLGKHLLKQKSVDNLKKVTPSG